MKVKTDYVPENALGYLTPGKVYDVVDCTKNRSKTCVIDDEGDEIGIYPPSCGILNGEPWTVVEESPITTECDALREENEMLDSENRRLLNENQELRKIQEVPEKDIYRVLDKMLIKPHEYTDCTILYTVTFEQIKRLFNHGRNPRIYPESAVRAVWEHGFNNGFDEAHRDYNGLGYDGYIEEVARIFTEALQKGE